MRATRPMVERQLTAFMDDPDPADMTNAIHSSDAAQEYGYTAALTDWDRAFATRYRPHCMDNF